MSERRPKYYGPEGPLTNSSEASSVLLRGFSVCAVYCFSCLAQPAHFLEQLTRALEALAGILRR